jgi:glycosyltransferase involved in cell wall biosynthesis
MSCGLPVIASRIPEFEGVIKDGENGLFFEPGDVKDLAEKLQLLIETITIRKSLGENARQFIIANFSNNRYKNEYENIYSALVKRR